MKIPDCPNNLKVCPKSMCPKFPCWAYDNHLDKLDKEKKSRDDGWE